MKLEVRNGKVVGWYCTVNKLYNDLLTVQCNFCSETRPINLEILANETALERQGFNLSDDKDLFMKLFNQERILVKDLDIVNLRLRKAELEEIISHAKIRRIAVDTEERERLANLRKSNREWTTTDKSIDSRIIDGNKTLDAIKERKKRMSKADKTADMLKNKLGLDIDEVNNLMARVDRVQTGASVSSSAANGDKVFKSKDVQVKSALCLSERHDECNGKFNDGLSKTCICECHKTKVIETEPKKNPFSFLKK